MLDLAFVREHLPLVEEKLRHRGMDPTEVLGRFRDLDAQRRSTIQLLEQARQSKKQDSEAIGLLLQKQKRGALSSEEESGIVAGKQRVAAYDVAIKQHEDALAAVEQEFKPLLAGIPNLPHESVPVGR